ncbi:Oxygen regulatory protein NreC [compost metagenome]
MSEAGTFYIVDDHPIMRDGLRLAIGNFSSGCQVVGETADLDIAYDEILKMKPDVVILDHKMPSRPGLDLLNKFSGKNPRTKFLLVTQVEQVEILAQYRDAGVDGILLKENSSNELQMAMRHLLDQKKYFCSSTLKILKETRPSDELTPREIEVIRHMAQGKSNKEIAQILNCSDQTIKAHKANLMRKINLSNTVEVSMWALKKGLV